MLPSAYGVPASLVLLLSGLLTCVAGYRLFRIVLGIYGFIIGAMIASSVMGAGNTLGMLAGALVGGLIGAVVLVLAYFVAIALVGAGLGALLGSMIWSAVGSGDPPALAIIVVSIVGAIGAMLLQRYVIIVGTAFGGAWTVVLGLTNILAARGVVQASNAGEVWILYPTSGPAWAPIAWLGLGLLGTAVQLLVTAGKTIRKK
jgi:hypothetical protein